MKKTTCTLLVTVFLTAVPLVPNWNPGPDGPLLKVARAEASWIDEFRDLMQKYGGIEGFLDSFFQLG